MENIKKIKELLADLKGARFGLDKDNDVEVIKNRILIEFDNDWHTLSGIINKIEDLLNEDKTNPPN